MTAPPDATPGCGSPVSIGRRPTPNCPLCGAEGIPLHRGLRDRFSDAPDEWTVDRCGNRSCRLLWLDPMPIESDIGRVYHADYYTHGDEAVPSVPLAWYRRASRWLKQGYLAGRYGYRLEATPRGQRLLGSSLRLMPRRRAQVDASVGELRFRPAGRLLEVGCGGGAVLKNLADLGWQTEGVDLDPVAVENARRKRLTVHLGSLHEQQLPGGSFDAVLLSHVIEHVHDPRALLAECRRLLKPEGTLTLLTPNAEGLCHVLFGASCFTLEPPRHLCLFNPANLGPLVEAAGFRVCAARTRSRGGREYWALSLEIRRRGRAGPSRARGFLERAGGVAFETLEALLVAMRLAAGDEILLMARPR